MAKNDFMIWNSPDGGHSLVRYGTLKASETFVAGEPVRLNTAGTLVECSDNPATGNDFGGIAVASGDTVGATDANGAFRFKIGAFTPGTGFPVAGDLVPYIVPTPTTQFITKNYDATTGVFGDTPTATTVIGNGLGIQIVSGTWGLALGGNQIARCVDLLDANFTPVGLSGGTGVWLVFVFTAAQNMAPTVNVDAAA